MVYLILNISKDRVKIGYSAKPSQRIKELRSLFRRDKLQLLYFIEGDMSLEKALHRKFNKYHLEYEWFENNDEILKFF